MDRELARALGEAARAARARQAGLTQADVAERVGIATEVYGRIERGAMLPSVETLRKLCAVLRASADELLGLPLTASRVSEPAEPYGEPPEIRRLTRRLKRLNPKQLRLLSLLAESFAHR
jgi:transcriptional regulator with XRE-family HTH domain